MKYLYLIVASLITSSTIAQVLPPVPVPTENPITAEKAVLGKILFWDEQLSSDNSISCGTCHIPANAGADPRTNGINPGGDGVLGTLDDIIGSLGIARLDSDGQPINDSVFGLNPQVTRRSAQQVFGSLWATDFFWDGRATSEFVDPMNTATVVIASGGGLESQSVEPILSSVEMAKEGRTWQEVITKLQRVTPLALSNTLPIDIQSALIANPTYEKLFSSAFGDSEISAARIGMAIATYERTLVPDQTPLNRFESGDTTALSVTEQQTWATYQSGGDNGISQCRNCHTPPQFTNNQFFYIGTHNQNEDTGREEVTGLVADTGRMKVPSLLNIGLKNTFMHKGDRNSVADAVNFYSQRNSFAALQDSVPNTNLQYRQFNLDRVARNQLAAFFENALIDPRVEAETFPFNRPKLQLESVSTAPIEAFVVNGATPTIADYINAGIIGVTDENLEQVNMAIGVINSASDVDSTIKIQTAVYSVIAPFSWDIDGNNEADALTDGLLLLRHLFGFSGQLLINNSVQPNASRMAAFQLESYLASLSQEIGDVDSSGSIDALTDGLLVLRYLLGFRGEVLTNGADTSATIDNAQIESNIQALMPSN